MAGGKTKSMLSIADVLFALMWDLIVGGFLMGGKLCLPGTADFV